MSYVVMAIGLGWIAANVMVGGQLPHSWIVTGALASVYLLAFSFLVRLGAGR